MIESKITIFAEGEALNKLILKLTEALVNEDQAMVEFTPQTVTTSLYEDKGRFYITVDLNGLEIIIRVPITALLSGDRDFRIDYLEEGRMVDKYNNRSSSVQELEETISSWSGKGKLLADFILLNKDNTRSIKKPNHTI